MCYICRCVLFCCTEYAKVAVNECVLSLDFDNIAKYHAEYNPTYVERSKHQISMHDMRRIKKIWIAQEVIKFYLPTELRTQLGSYCNQIGTFIEWREIDPAEQAKTRYATNHGHKIFYGTLNVNKDSKAMLIGKNCNALDDLNELAETCLFSCLVCRGVPRHEASGWITTTEGKPHYHEKIKEYIDKTVMENGKLQIRCVSTLASYQARYGKYNLQEQEEYDVCEEPPLKRRRV